MQPTPSVSRRRHRKSANAGFTLVEVLAALIVTMLLVLALTPFVGQMLAVWARGSEAASLVELRTRGIGRLRDDLRHAIAWTGFGQSENLVTFRGDENSISFPAATGLGAGRDGVEMLSITVDTSVDGRALVRRRAPLVGLTYVSFRDPVVLFSGPYKYGFRYYPRTGPPLANWLNQAEPPDRIELTIAGVDGWRTTIEIPLFASMPAACLANRRLPGCTSVATDREEEEMMKRIQMGLPPVTESP